MRRVLISRDLFPLWVLILALWFPFADALAQTDDVNNTTERNFVEAFPFYEGEHYTALDNPVASPSPFVIVFSYFGSESLRLISPALFQWSRETGIAMTLAPAHSDTVQLASARLHHTLSRMGELGRLYESAFELFQTDDSVVFGEARINAFLSIWEVDQDVFWETWESEAVSQLLNSSMKLTQIAGVTSTPAFLVQGRFLVDTKNIEGESLLPLLEYLAYKDLPESQ